MEYLDAIQHRRSYYVLDSTSPISDERIEQIIGHCLTYVPSAFHSQTARVVALFGDNHTRLWKIVEDTLRARVPAERFGSTEAKLKGFSAGHATLLFFEEQDTVKGLQDKFPSYADNFPLWSLQASGMVQFGRQFDAGDAHVAPEHERSPVQAEHPGERRADGAGAVGVPFGPVAGHHTTDVVGLENGTHDHRRQPSGEP